MIGEQHPYGEPEWLELIEAIRQSPDDDAPRLAAAEWLEVRGEFDLGEFIRLQCQWAKAKQPIPGYRGRLLGLCDSVPLLRGAGTWGELRWIRAFECGGLLPYGDCPPFMASVSRGFVTRLVLDVVTWIEHGPAIVRTNPIEFILFADRKPLDCGPIGWRWVTETEAVEEPGETRGADATGGDEERLAQLDRKVAFLKHSLAVHGARVDERLRPAETDHFDTLEGAEGALSRRAIRWAHATAVNPSSTYVHEVPGDAAEKFHRWKGEAIRLEAKKERAS